MAAADEAFALSPISARAALPSEADYDAIREAFMETARGRWFLGEYAKRNRNADTSMVLDAVARIEATIAAQKQAPDHSNDLPDALVRIRGMLSDAKADAVQAMSGPEAEQALTAVIKGIRIIREIAWRLREYGTDARICDMLDAQAGAIEASHNDTIAPAKRGAVLATFDVLIRRIGELGGAGAPRPASGFEMAARSTSPVVADDATGERAEVTPPPVETARETLRETQDQIPEQDFDQASEQTSNQVLDSLPDRPSGDIVAANQTATEAKRPPAGDSPEALSRQSEALTESGSTAEIGPTVLLDEDVIVAGDEETADLDDEAVHDLALLDAIAQEMAEPDLVESDLVESDLVESDLAESDVAESDLAEPEPARPGLTGLELASAGVAEPPHIAEPVIAAPSKAIAVKSALETAVAPEFETKPPPSLGASLIASGIVSRTSSTHDALAPIRRMSQAERIAFFS